MTQNAWCRLRVTGVTPGATYESETFDQYISAIAEDGTAIELFDMAPMMGVGLAPGVEFAALIAVDAHTGFGPGGGDGTIVVSAPAELERVDLPTVRAEVFGRPWAVVAYRGSIPVLLAGDRLKGVAGGPVTWREAVFVLMGWRPASAM